MVFLFWLLLWNKNVCITLDFVLMCKVKKFQKCLKQKKKQCNKKTPSAIFCAMQ